MDRLHPEAPAGAGQRQGRRQQSQGLDNGPSNLLDLTFPYLTQTLLFFLV